MILKNDQGKLDTQKIINFFFGKHLINKSDLLDNLSFNQFSEFRRELLLFEESNMYKVIKSGSIKLFISTLSWTFKNEFTFKLIQLKDILLLLMLISFSSFDQNMLLNIVSSFLDKIINNFFLISHHYKYYDHLLMW